MASYLQSMAIEYFLLPSACKVRNLNSSKKLWQTSKEMSIWITNLGEEDCKVSFTCKKPYWIHGRFQKVPNLLYVFLENNKYRPQQRLCYLEFDFQSSNKCVMIYKCIN